MYRCIVCYSFLAFLSACGGGSSSNGGMNEELRGERADSCISERGVDNADMTSTTDYINSCNYDVNVRDFPNLPVILVTANSTVTVPGVQVFVGACRAPSFPVEGGTIDSYLCSIL